MHTFEICNIWYLDCLGRLTLTNKALYFEASGTISYDPALKVDLSDTEIEHQINTASTGPFGVPLFDKAIVFESL